MNMKTNSKVVTHSFFAKVEEQIELMQALVLMTPPDRLEWQPSPNAFRVCDLFGHLLETLAGFCAALYKMKPEPLAHFAKLKDLPVNHCCGIEETLRRIQEYKTHIAEGSSLLRDADL